MADRFIPLTPHAGAKAEMRREELLDPAFADECLDALENYGVLAFPQIDLSDEEQVAFSEYLGEIIPLGPKGPDGTRGATFKVSLDPRENPAAEYLKGTIGWHIDGLHEEGPPPRATVLMPRRLPSAGSQTEFCSTYAAYDDLSEEEQKDCESLHVVHSLVAGKLYTDPCASPEELARRRAHPQGETEHPLVWRHQSGRKSLILGMSVDHVIGMPKAESRALIERLMASATRPERVYRHEWQMGDLVVWNNCGMMHRAVPYAADSGRLMHRITLHGVEMIKGV